MTLKNRPTLVGLVPKFWVRYNGINGSTTPKLVAIINEIPKNKKEERKVWILSFVVTLINCELLFDSCKKYIGTIDNKDTTVTI